MFKNKSAQTVKYEAKFWDQRLYESLNKSWKIQPSRCVFSCLINKRASEIGSYTAIFFTQDYQGSFRVWLDDPSEFCDIPVYLSIESPSDSDLESHRFGYLSFGCSNYGPYINVVLKDNLDFSKILSNLYVESKMLGREGLELLLVAQLNEIVELNAEKIWGNWDEYSELFDENGELKAEFPGHKKFPLDRFSFTAEI